MIRSEVHLVSQTKLPLVGWITQIQKSGRPAGAAAGRPTSRWCAGPGRGAGHTGRRTPLPMISSEPNEARSGNDLDNCHLWVVTSRSHSPGNTIPQTSINTSQHHNTITSLGVAKTDDEG